MLTSSWSFLAFLQDFGLFIGTVSEYKQMFFLGDSPQKVDNINPAILFCVFLHFVRSLLVKNSITSFNFEWP